jgi:hypothetical protein
MRLSGRSFEMARPLASFSIVCVVLLAAHGARGNANPVFDQLMRDGVPVGGRDIARLPAPTLADGLSAAQQRQAIEAICAGSHTWEDLTRRSVVAPFILKVKADERANHLGRRVDLWFIAYGNLATLENNEWLERQFKSTGNETDAENGAVVKVVPADELRRLGLKPHMSPPDPQYVFAELTLLDRVRLSVTTRGAQLQSPDSALTASLLDPHFDNVPQSPNRWRPVLRDDAGRRHLGKPQPFTGYGSYAKATRLLDPPGAILIEYHVAFEEPEGWFNGTNMLRSKLPILAQMIVRQLRRELAKSN